MQKLGPTSESRIAEISWPFGLVFAIPDTEPAGGTGWDLKWFMFYKANGRLSWCLLNTMKGEKYLFW